MTDFQRIYNQELGSSVRTKINEQFEELYRADYLAYFGFGFNSPTAETGEDVIPNDGAWHTIGWECWPSDPMLLEDDRAGGVITFPNTSSVGDKTGVWFGTVFVGFKNDTPANLELHTRKVRFVISNGIVTLPVGCRTLLFDPAFGTTGDPSYNASVSGTAGDGMAWSYAMCFTQFHLSPSGAPWDLVVQVCHNATVAGSPVSLTTKLDLFQTPLLMLGRACKFE